MKDSDDSTIHSGSAPVVSGPDVLPAAGGGSGAGKKGAAAARAAAEKPYVPAGHDSAPARLRRFADSFISPPMTDADIEATMAGYPGEYEVYRTPTNADAPAVERAPDSE